MSIDERITFDDQALFQHLEARLDQLLPFQYDSKYRTLLGNDIIQKLSLWDKSIRRQKDVPLTVVVCGEFKRGKSSLINALLGEDVVTTNITTETITVNRISYGPHSNELLLSGGRRIALTDEELKCDNLKEILAQLPAGEQITMLELKRPLEILQQVTIIDTPGLGDSMKDFTAEVEYALKQADAVIYVFSVLYPLSVQEQFFIRTAIAPQNYTKLFLVANSCDMLECREDCDRLAQTIRDRMEDILPAQEALMLSALDERCRQKGKRPPNAELSSFLSENFARFREEIEELLQAKRTLVVPDRINRMLGAMLRELDADLSAIYESLSLSMEDLAQKKAQIHGAKQQQAQAHGDIIQSIDKKAELYRSQAIGWISTLIDLMEADVDSLSAVSVEDIKKFYAVFCVDTMRAAVDRCSEYFTQALYEELETVCAEAARKLSMAEAAPEVSFKFALNTKTWTSGDKLEFAHGVAQSVLGISSLLVSFVAGSMRQSEMKKQAPDLLADIRSQYPQLRTSVLPAISGNYAKIAQHAKKQLAAYFADRQTELDHQLSQAEQIARQDEAKKLEIRAAVDEIAAVLQSIREDL